MQMSSALFDLKADYMLCRKGEIQQEKKGLREVVVAPHAARVRMGAEEEFALKEQKAPAAAEKAKSRKKTKATKVTKTTKEKKRKTNKANKANKPKGDKTKEGGRCKTKSGLWTQYEDKENESEGDTEGTTETEETEEEKEKEEKQEHKKHKQKTATQAKATTKATKTTTVTTVETAAEKPKAGNETTTTNTTTKASTVTPDEEQCVEVVEEEAPTQKPIKNVIDKRMRTSHTGYTRLQYQVRWAGKKENGADWKPAWIEADEVPLKEEYLVDRYEARIAEGERKFAEEKRLRDLEPSVVNIYNRLVLENAGASQWYKCQLWTMAEQEFAKLPLAPRRRR